MLHDLRYQASTSPSQLTLPPMYVGATQPGLIQSPEAQKGSVGSGPLGHRVNCCRPCLDLGAGGARLQSSNMWHTKEFNLGETSRRSRGVMVCICKSRAHEWPVSLEKLPTLVP